MLLVSLILSCFPFICKPEESLVGVPLGLSWTANFSLPAKSTKFCCQEGSYKDGFCDHALHILDGSVGLGVLLTDDPYLESEDGVRPRTLVVHVCPGILSTCFSLSKMLHQASQRLNRGLGLSSCEELVLTVNSTYIHFDDWQLF